MKDDSDSTDRPGEAFAARWSRRKREAARISSDSKPRAEETTTASSAVEPSAVAPELPSPESLGDDDDYSLFMAAGVDEKLRNAALRRLFRAPRYNLRDGLCEYDDDYTQRTVLGEWVIAKLREQQERWLQWDAQTAPEDTHDASLAASEVPPDSDDDDSREDGDPT